METGCKAQTTEPYALRVMGDTMSPEFNDGHIIIVDPALPPHNGAFVVIDYGGEVILGRYVSEDGRKWIQYMDESLSPIELVPPFEHKGVVVQRVGRRRKDRKYYEYSGPDAEYMNA